MGSLVNIKNVHRVVPTQSDALAAVSSVTLAFAIVCKHSDVIMLVSEGMQAILPNLQKNALWRVGVSQNAELLSAFDGALSSEETEVSTNVAINGTKHCIDFKHYDDNLYVVSIQSNPSVENISREFRLACDNLFPTSTSTSKSISVGEMATTLAHELNTPIGTIGNILHGVKMRLKKPDTTLEAIDTAIERALDQTLFSQNIISRIRDFTQSQRPEFSVIDIRQQLKEAVTLIDWLLSHSDCRVELQMPDDPLYINGDATMLQQVLINLLRNAVDAMHQQSVERRKIVIVAELNNDKVTISIADTGHGLEENGDKLFIPFATNKADGMGVGLNICRSLVEMHQGRLWLSANESEGCTCFVELSNASNEELHRRGAI